MRHAARVGVLGGRSPLTRLQSDEKLIELIRAGHPGAFEALFERYQARLLSFCRHMLGSKEDAEDVLQEVFASAYNAIRADDRPINARPWLYRIARNRSLNHLRKPVPAGVDSMDIHMAEHGLSTADRVQGRDDFRQLVGDVQLLPESQRSALLLREIDALSYDQIADVMDTSVPSVKSLLVRARISLAEAAEARKLTCEEVRGNLGEMAEGLGKLSPPVRRHVRTCDECREFKRHLAHNNRALAAIYPIGALVMVKKVLLGKLGAGLFGSSSASTGAGGGAVAGSGAAAAGGAAAGGAAAGGGAAVPLGLGGALAGKAAAVGAAAVLVTAGAVEVKHVTDPVNQAAKISQAKPGKTPLATAEPTIKAETPTPVSQPVPVPAPAPQPTTPEPSSGTKTNDGPTADGKDTTTLPQPPSEGLGTATTPAEPVTPPESGAPPEGGPPPAPPAPLPEP